MNEDGGNITVQNPNPVGAEVARGGEKENKKKNSKKPFIIILSALVVLIVGLLVAILVINLTHSEPEEGGNGGEIVAPVDDNVVIVEDIRNELGEMTDDEAQEYLDDKINEYKEDNPAVAVDLTISKAYIKLSAGDTAGALEILETIDATRIEGQTLMKYYAAMRDVYKLMGDEAKYQEYVELYFKIYLEVFNGGAGGE